MEDVDERGEGSGVAGESSFELPVEVVIDSREKVVVGTGFPSLIFIVLSLSLRERKKNSYKRHFQLISFR